MSLPEGWESGIDPDGRTYYVNHKTQQTQWEPPANAGPSAPPPMYENRATIQATAVPAMPAVAAVPAVSNQRAAVPAAQNVHVQHPAVTQQPGHTVVVVQEQQGSRPPNAPAGGQWIQEQYCGIITWLVGIFVFPCVCCCPCDSRTVYIVNNVRYNPLGAIVPPGNCC